MAETKKVADAINTHEPAELSREALLAAVKFIEAENLEATKKITEAAQAKRIPPQKVHKMLVVERLKTNDRLFNTTGTEEADIKPNILRLGLQNDEELKTVIEGFRAQKNAWLADRKAQAEKAKAAMAEKASAAATGAEETKK